MGDRITLKELLHKLENSLPVCRVCLKDTLEYVDFEAPFCTMESFEVTYYDAYNTFTCLPVTLGQYLPSRLCFTCAGKLVCAYKFSRQVERGERILKRIENFIDYRDMNAKHTTANVEQSGINAVSMVIQDATVDTAIGNRKVTHGEEEEFMTNSEAKSQDIVFFANIRGIDVDDEDILESSKEEEEGEEEQYKDPPIHFKCKDCGKVCESEVAYRRHCMSHKLAISKKKARERIRCKECGKGFRMYIDLEKHLFLHAMAEVKINKWGQTHYTCNTCSKTYQSVSAFIDHMHIHNGTKPYRCNMCGKFHHTKLELMSHKYHTHGEGLAAKEDEDKNMETDSLRFKKECRYCGKLLANKAIQQHEKMHEDPQKRYECNVCSKLFYTQQNLSSHTQTHLEQRSSFKCNICGQEMLRQQSLKIHMQRHATEEDKFKCDICGTVLSAKSTLAEHMAKHLDPNKYKCVYCEKNFWKKSRLVYHMRIHTGEKPYKCDQCEKSYVVRARLKDHIKVEHANHTFDCDKCDAKFKSYGGLVRHKVLHTGYPFTCPLCEAGSVNRDRLKLHVLQVHKGYMTEEQFNRKYPKKSEARKVEAVTSR